MGLKVKATARGYYGDLMDEGREFEIADLGAFSKNWMEPVGWDLEEERAKAAKPAAAPEPAKAPEPQSKK